MQLQASNCETSVRHGACQACYIQKVEPKLDAVTEGAEAIQLPLTCHTKGANAAGTPVAHIIAGMEWAPAADPLDLLSG